MIGENLFNSRPQNWKRFHTLLSPAFTDKNMQFVVEATQQLMQKLIQKINEEPERSVFVDASHLTADVIGVAGFGHSFNCIEGKEDQLFVATKQLLQISSYFRFLPAFLVKILGVEKKAEHVSVVDYFYHFLIRH